MRGKKEEREGKVQFLKQLLKCQEQHTKTGNMYTSFGMVTCCVCVGWEDPGCCPGPGCWGNGCCWGGGLVCDGIS